MSQGHLQLWEIKETKDNYQAVQTDTNEWRHSVICIHQQITIWKGIETNNSPSITSTLIKDFAMDGMRMTRLAHWKLYTLAENYPEYMDRYSITMERLRMAIPWNASSIWNEDSIWVDRSELLCHQLLLKYKRDRESFWHGHQKAAERVPTC